MVYRPIRLNRTPAATAVLNAPPSISNFVALKARSRSMNAFRRPVITKPPWSARPLFVPAQNSEHEAFWVAHSNETEARGGPSKVPGAGETNPTEERVQLLRNSTIAAKAGFNLADPVERLHLVRRDRPFDVDVSADGETLAAAIDRFMEELIARAKLQRLIGLRPRVACRRETERQQAQCHCKSRSTRHSPCLSISLASAR